jgi:NitT/TauT family transport system substrate-binding protein
MEKGIKLLVDTYKLPNTPAVKDVFDRSFLPPKSERMLKLNF